MSPGSGGSVSSGDYLGDQCSAGGTWNRGSEYDWLRFLWDLDTDTDTGTTIHTTQIADLWDDANPHTWRSGDSGTADRPWTRMAAPCASMQTKCLAKGISNGVTR